MLAWQILFVNWESWTIHFMIDRTYVQDKPFGAAQALRCDTHLVQKYFTACRTCLCKGHELGSDRIKTEMQVKQMITYRRTCIQWRKNGQDTRLKKIPKPLGHQVLPWWVLWWQLGNLEHFMEQLYKILCYSCKVNLGGNCC